MEHLDSTKYDNSSNPSTPWDTLTDLAESDHQTTWADVEAMADQPAENAEAATSVESERDARRREILDEMQFLFSKFEDDDLDTKYADRMDALVDNLTKERWGNDDEVVASIRSVGGTVNDLLEFGMSPSKIIENDEYYAEFRDQDDYDIHPVGMWGQIYDAAAQFPESLVRFKHDFAGKIDVREPIRILLAQNEADRDKAIADLRAAHACGDAVLSSAQHALYDFEKKNPSLKAEEEVHLFHDLTVNLIEEGVVGEADVSNLYQKFERGYVDNGARGALQALTESGIRPQPDDTDGQFWYSLSDTHGMDYLTNDGGVRFDKLDFTNELVFKVGLNITKHNNNTKNLLNDTNLKEALKDPIRQNEVLSTIAGMQRDADDIENIFKLLAQNDEILASLNERSAYDQYPELREIESLSKFVSGEYTEKDRLVLFDGYYGGEGYVECFDESGNPTKSYFEQLTKRGFDAKDHYYLNKEELKIGHIYGELRFADRALSWRGKELNMTPEEMYGFFDENGPRPEFYSECFRTKNFEYLHLVRGRDGVQDGLGSVRQSFLTVNADRLQWMVQDEDYQDENHEWQVRPWTENVAKYFDENGPRPEYWQECFDRGELGYLCEYKEFLDNRQRLLVALWEQSPQLYSQYDQEIQTMGEDGVTRFSNNLDRIINSNSYEMVAGSNNLIEALFMNEQSSDVEKSIERIEDVFLKNNLPYIGKILRTFQIIYPESKGYGKAGKVMERGALAGRENWGWRGKQNVLWNDVLKTAIGSGSSDLREYVEGLQRGDTPEYAAHLATLYNQTERGKREPFDATGDTARDIEALESLFGAGGHKNVADTVVRSFGYGLRIKSADELLRRMDEQHAEADKRNRERAERGDFRLVAGDMLKTTNVEHLGDILRNGALCKEFLNGQANSDATPLDTDLNVLSENANLDGTISRAVDWKNRIAAFGGMHCVLALKGDVETGRGRFSQEGDPYRPEKYEIWHNDRENYGIRSGFPSSEIDFIIHDEQNEEDYFGDLERMKFEIARNGLYIPIVDKDTGKCVFMPDDYDKLREHMGGVSEYGFNTFDFADSLEVPGMSDILDELSANREMVDRQYGAIISEVIQPALAEMGLEYQDSIDGKLTPGTVQVINTGSTGRGDNTPGDGDYDMMVKVDRRILVNPDQMKQLRQQIASRLGTTDPGGNFRKVKWATPDGEEVELDITFAQKTNKVGYSTDMALKDRLDTIRELDPSKADEVVANIIFAKQFFKEIGAYKPKHAGGNIPDSEKGGMGGVGIENWILNNGGSFVAAARDFMAAADQSTSFPDFCSRYSVFDFGVNHGRKGRVDTEDSQIGTTGNFIVNNMNDTGYNKIKAALEKFLRENQ